jgi:drug/metabolite transporter (DMT)-like permease
MLSILYGLSSALVWGAADFFGGLASRKARAFQAVLYGEAFGLILLLLSTLFIHEQPLTLKSWLLCSFAGSLGVLGLLMFFYAFEKGQMTIVAPVSALTATILPVIVGSLTEGFPGYFTFAGFALALVAIYLVSKPAGDTKSLRLRIKDLALPLLGGVCFGIYFVIFHEGSQQGLLMPLIASRSAGTLTMIIFLLVTHQSFKPAPAGWPYFLLNGILDVSGNGFYLLAGQVGRLDISAVLVSLYPASTVLLAWLFLHEKISRSQSVGILAALVAIALMTI